MAKNDGLENLREDVVRKAASELQLLELPNGILDRILSKCTLKDVVRTSILSSKWKHIWKKHDNLIFDVADIVGARKLIHGGGYMERENWMEPRREAFIKIVDTVLQHHSGVDVTKFKIKFGFHLQHASHLDRWINFAIAAKASDLAFDFCLPSYIKPERYSFPFHLISNQSGSHIRSLYLGFICLDPPLDFSGLRNLKVLHLCEVNMLQDLQQLLPQCYVLESLSVTRCPQLTSIKTSHPLYCLHYLYIECCFALRSIESVAPNLVTFVCKGPTVQILLDESKKLKKAEVVTLIADNSFQFVFAGLPSALPHLESLFLCMVLDMKMTVLHGLPGKFMQLRYLRLYLSFYSDENGGGPLKFTSILKVAPFLERLDVQMVASSTEPFNGTVQNIVSPCQHKHLKEVYMREFFAIKGQIDFARFILNSADALQAMIIDTKYAGGMKASENQKCDARRIAQEFLGREDRNNALSIL